MARLTRVWFVFRAQSSTAKATSKLTALKWAERLSVLPEVLELKANDLTVLEARRERPEPRQAKASSLLMLERPIGDKEGIR